MIWITTKYFGFGKGLKFTFALLRSKSNEKAWASLGTCKLELSGGIKICWARASPRLIDEVIGNHCYIPDKSFEIQPSFNVVDLGANIGTFTLYAANHARKVIAIEPEEENYDALLRNIKINSYLAISKVK